MSGLTLQPVSAGRWPDLVDLFEALSRDGTGGEAYYLANDSPVTFTPYFNELSERMKHQYLLTFAAQPGQKSGFQPIKVSTEIANVDLVAPHHVYVSTGS